MPNLFSIRRKMGMSVSIRIKGIDTLIQKFGKVEGTKHLRQPMERSVTRIFTGLENIQRKDQEAITFVVMDSSGAKRRHPKI